jgi:hypothetical protein
MMKEKPYRVTMTYLKNVAKRHRPAIYEERTKDETFWVVDRAHLQRRVFERYGYQVAVKSVAILPGWADVTF